MYAPQRQTPDRVEKFNEIGRKKKRISPRALGKGHPVEFVSMLEYARNLAFDERPNYDKMRAMLGRVFQNRKCRTDGRYDWDRKGKNVTELALENHPFVCGNKAPQNFTKVLQKIDGGSDEFADKWGGKKHHRMCAKEETPL